MYILCIKLKESDVWTVLLHIVIVFVKARARARLQCICIKCSFTCFQESINKIKNRFENIAGTTICMYMRMCVCIYACTYILSHPVLTNTVLKTRREIHSKRL